MRLEVGMYVRTKNGITQYKKYKTTRGYLLCMPLKNGTFADIGDITNASYNIIDLIEKNDLVVDNYENIYVVDYVFDNYVYTKTKQGNITKTLCDYQIKSIVTKECFESMKYEVE